MQALFQQPTPRTTSILTDPPFKGVCWMCASNRPLDEHEDLRSQGLFDCEYCKNMICQNHIAFPMPGVAAPFLGVVICQTCNELLMQRAACPPPPKAKAKKMAIGPCTECGSPLVEHYRGCPIELKAKAASTKYKAAVNKARKVADLGELATPMGVSQPAWEACEADMRNPKFCKACGVIDGDTHLGWCLAKYATPPKVETCSCGSRQRPRKKDNTCINCEKVRA